MFFCFLYIIYFYLFLCFRTFLCNFIHFSDYCNAIGYSNAKTQSHIPATRIVYNVLYVQCTLGIGSFAD